MDGILALLADVRVTMPPLAAWFDGRDVGQFLSERVFATPWRLVPIRANGQPAFACYQQNPDDRRRFRLGAINVLGLRDGQIVEITGFLDPEVHRRFGLSEELLQRPPHVATH
jgi:hypothetical protein